MALRPTPQTPRKAAGAARGPKPSVQADTTNEHERRPPAAHQATRGAQPPDSRPAEARKMRQGKHHTPVEQSQRSQQKSGRGRAPNGAPDGPKDAQAGRAHAERSEAL